MENMKKGIKYLGKSFSSGQMKSNIGIYGLIYRSKQKE